MKKSTILLPAAALCTVIVCVYPVMPQRNPTQLRNNQVEKIQFGHSSTAAGFNAEETAKFIKLFIAATYPGEDSGYGTTPYYCIVVYFHDGSNLMVNEYGNHIFRVSHYAEGREIKDFFIESRELDEFMSERMEK